METYKKEIKIVYCTDYRSISDDGRRRFLTDIDQLFKKLTNSLIKCHSIFSVFRETMRRDFTHRNYKSYKQLTYLFHLKVIVTRYPILHFVELLCVTGRREVSV